MLRSARAASSIQSIAASLQNNAQGETNMKKHLGMAVVNFLGTAVMACLFDLLAARLNLDEFMQTIRRPGHIAFVIVLGLILAVGTLTGPATETPEASREMDNPHLSARLGQCI